MVKPLKMEFDLTPCQHHASTEILKWVYDDDKLFMTLAGPAGTGKSWLSKFILNQIKHLTVCVSAPTHKALKEVKKASGFSGKTLQALLGLAVNQDVEDFDPVNLKFDKQNDPQIENYNLILLDEASMVQSSLREYLQELAIKEHTKILFVGDPIQLPPVNEIVSTVFQNKHIDGGVVYLSTPCRQSAANPAFTLLLADRNDIEQSNQAWEVLIDHLKTQGIFTEDLHVKLVNLHQNTYKVLREHLGNYQINADGEGYRIYNSRAEFETQMKKTFLDYHGNGDFNSVRALAWRNDVVKEHNKVIRGCLFPDVTDNLVEGDLLMCYRPITRWDSVTRSTYTLVHNSDEVEITNANKAYSNMGIKIYSVLAETDGDTSHAIDFVDSDGYEDYIQHFSDFKNAATKLRKWKPFYGFYDQHLLLDNLGKLYKNRTLPNKAFDYAYSLTVHKSQGSTYNEVFVNLTDILHHYTVQKYLLQKKGEWTPETDRVYQRITRQLRYVAASRAKKFTHFLI